MRRAVLVGPVVLTLGASVAAGIGPVANAAGKRPAAAAVRHRPGKIDTDTLSSGAKAWFLGPQQPQGERPHARVVVPSLGSNVDANNPQRDFAAGQSETAIAAAGRRVMVAWNDATGFLVAPSTNRRASLTGVGFSSTGGRRFTDLLGLPNNNAGQQWFGDPTVVALDHGRHFIVGSLYLPSNQNDCSTGPALFELAVSVATVGADNRVSFTEPIVAASGGDFCQIFTQNNPPPNLAFLDKEFLSYNGHTRTLALSYTRFFFGFGGQSGNGQIELVRAHVPANPRYLRSSSFSQPIVVWPEEQNVVNTGAYPAVARGGDVYVAWERNIDSNLFNGHPLVYIHAARVRAGESRPVVGGRSAPRVVSLGQANGNDAGGVRSLNSTAIAGYNRGTGNDFPRIAVDGPKKRVVVVWNDASHHPLGDIWLRALPMSLAITGPIRRVNDDRSYALHFLPAVSVRSDGSVVTSWYDRRRARPDSARTDYFAEIRNPLSGNRTDVRVTTGLTDWTNTSTLITPNFGDYTDNASTGKRTYFTWSDGRLGVPQPFVDSR